MGFSTPITLWPRGLAQNPCSFTSSIVASYELYIYQSENVIKNKNNTYFNMLLVKKNIIFKVLKFVFFIFKVKIFTLYIYVGSMLII